MESWRNSESDYERGFIDGMQKQMQSSVDKAVNAMSQRTWVGLTDEERKDTLQSVNTGFVVDASVVALAIEAKLKEKNG
jgi:dipeptide/tripeptide permease